MGAAGSAVRARGGITGVRGLPHARRLMDRLRMREWVSIMAGKETGPTR